MRKDRVTIEIGIEKRKNNKTKEYEDIKVLKFYLDSEVGYHIPLFSQKFTKSVFEYFENGRSIPEILGFKDWRLNPRLNKTIDKLPMYIKFQKQAYIDDLAYVNTKAASAQIDKSEREYPEEMVA